MRYTATWGPKGFIISEDKIVSLNDFSTSYALKTDTNEDTSGTPPTNTKGLELQEITLSTTYSAAMGTIPRAQIAEWKAQIGNSYPLYIKGKVFGPPKLQLIKVDVSDVVFLPDGGMFSCTISVTLREYSPASATNAAVKKAAAGGNNSASSASKSAAMSATASTQDKESKKTSSGKVKGAMLN